MKRTVILLTALFITAQTFAQQVAAGEVTKKNSWLKAGLSAGIPVGDISNFSSFAAGIELSGQVMGTNHFGFGIASGYTHFFPKDNFEGFGAIPLGVMLRYYPMYEGFFVGTDIGYTFLTNVTGSTGGAYIKPQVGYHNYNWNIYALYNQVFRSQGIDIQDIGIAATYNIHFK